MRLPDGDSVIYATSKEAVMRVTAGILLLAAGLSTAACTTMRPVSLDELGAMRPAEAVVTKHDQTVVVVSGPQTVGDTLMGYVNGRFEEIPAENLQEIRVKRPARAKTAAVVAAGLAGIAAVAVAISSTGDYDNPADRLDCEDDPDQQGCPNNPNPM
jgi:hypothetical protein